MHTSQASCVRRAPSGWIGILCRALLVKRPNTRTVPGRASESHRPKLYVQPPRELIAELLKKATYRGSSKHKANPRRFGLPHYGKPRGDATLCDEHANFGPQQMKALPELLFRGISAGLLGELMTENIPTVLWTVGDDGWIFEMRITNSGRAEYHGYPVRPTEAIAEMIYKRFAEWAYHDGAQDDRLASQNCKALYGFRE